MSRRLEIIGLLVLLIAVFIPRWPALGDFATVDESSWLMRSANFYYALGQRDFEKTIYAYHPAVTTMWIGTAALLLDFPEYRGLGQGYFEKEWQFAEFLSEQGYTPLEMLKSSRQIYVIINIILFGIIYLLLKRLIDWTAAFFATLFLSLAPFLLGYTRILAHEGMMSLLLLVSILAFLNYIWKDFRWQFLALSAVAAALADLTKSSATIIIPFVGLLSFLEIAKTTSMQKDNSVAFIKQQIKRFAFVGLIWFGIFSITFVAIWPGMWVQPRKMISEMYGNAFSYALEGHNLEIQDFDEIASAPSQNMKFQKFANDILWITTPITWMGMLLFLGLIFFRSFHLHPNARRLMLTFIVFGFLFYCMMSIAKGRQGARYILATISSLNLVAGLAIAFSVSVIRGKLSSRLGLAIPSIMFAALISLQVLSIWSFYPYYFNYANPILGLLQEGMQTPVLGFGEGLELAAQEITQYPDSENLTVLSWFGEGPFSYFFPGKTENLYPSIAWTPGLIDRLQTSDYLVVYYYHQLKRNMPVKLISEIKNLEPEHSIWINGIEYVRIYKVSNLPDTLLIPDAPDLP